nr:CBM_HP1_G0031900.mRNA.1.CDS.1 [Saccharomyces cerevisiae]
MSATSSSGDVKKFQAVPKPTSNASPPPASSGFNARTLWPDLIETPENQWVESVKILAKDRHRPDRWSSGNQNMENP